MIVSTRLKSLITSLPLRRMPFFAPFPIPATFDTGTPITKAPGQPNTRIVIANSISFDINQTINANTKTVGVYHLENLSINLSASDLES